MFKTDKKVQKRRPHFLISVFFPQQRIRLDKPKFNTSFRYCKNLFPDKLKIDELPPVVYSLGKTIKNKVLNYKEAVSSTDTNDNITYGTSIVECD